MKILYKISVATVAFGFFLFSVSAKYVNAMNMLEEGGALETQSDNVLEESNYTYNEAMEEYPEYVNDNIHDWYNDQGELEYPVGNEVGEFKEYEDYEAKIAACQLPDELLESLSTKELLDIVLEYPLISTIIQYDTYQEGYNTLIKTFNGFNELLNREDYVETVLSVYQNFAIPQNTQLDYDELINENSETEDLNRIRQDDKLLAKACEDAKVYYKLTLLELILAQNSTCEELSQKEENEVLQLVDEHSEELYKSEYGFDEEYSAFEVVVDTLCILSDWNEDTVSVSEVGILSATTLTSTSTSGFKYSTTTTRGGITVDIKIYTNPVKNSYAYVLENTSNFNIVMIASVGDQGYNCAAYAWLYDTDTYGSLRENCWLSVTEAEATFEKDVHYTAIRKPSVGAVIKYVNGAGTHYGVVLSTNYTWKTSEDELRTEPLIISKWGSGGLIIHPLSQCVFADSYDAKTVYTNYLYYK